MKYVLYGQYKIYYDPISRWWYYRVNELINAKRLFCEAIADINRRTKQ